MLFQLGTGWVGGWGWGYLVFYVQRYEKPVLPESIVPNNIPEDCYDGEEAVECCCHWRELGMVPSQTLTKVIRSVIKTC
jgi:hypothetical protein